jgi:hypothetical protein
MCTWPHNVTFTLELSHPATTEQLLRAVNHDALAFLFTQKQSMTPGEQVSGLLPITSYLLFDIYL